MRLDRLEAQPLCLWPFADLILRPRRGIKPQGPARAAAARSEEEPVQSHLKLTIADGHFTLLGSGNMDRASWFTSQELGILFCDSPFAATVQARVSSALDGRLDMIFDSERD